MAVLMSNLRVDARSPAQPPMHCSKSFLHSTGSCFEQREGEAVKTWAVVVGGRLERYLEAHGHLERKIVNRSRDVAKHLVLEPAKTRGDARQILEAGCCV